MVIMIMIIIIINTIVLVEFVVSTTKVTAVLCSHRVCSVSVLCSHQVYSVSSFSHPCSVIKLFIKERLFNIPAFR